jgi:hypothetical protein
MGEYKSVNRRVNRSVNETLSKTVKSSDLIRKNKLKEKEEIQL